MRRLVFGAVVAAGSLLAPSSASALFLIEEGARAKTTYFEANDCQAAATVSLTAPTSATNVEPQSLEVGETVTAHDSYFEAPGFATITAAEAQQRAGRPAIVWTAIPDPAICQATRSRTWGGTA